MQNKALAQLHLGLQAARLSLAIMIMREKWQLHCCQLTDCNTAVCVNFINCLGLSTTNSSSSVGLEVTQNLVDYDKIMKIPEMWFYPFLLLLLQYCTNHPNNILLQNSQHVIILIWFFIQLTPFKQVVRAKPKDIRGRGNLIVKPIKVVNYKIVDQELLKTKLLLSPQSIALIGQRLVEELWILLISGHLL